MLALSIYFLFRKQSETFLVTPSGTLLHLLCSYSEQLIKKEKIMNIEMVEKRTWCCKWNWNTDYILLKSTLMENSVHARMCVHKEKGAYPKQALLKSLLIIFNLPVQWFTWIKNVLDSVTTSNRCFLVLSTLKWIQFFHVNKTTFYFKWEA